MNKIKVVCFTNLDINKTWPRELDNRPLIGEYIASEQGYRLRIVAITHRYDGKLEIELHK